MSLDVSLRIPNPKYKEWKENRARSLKEAKEHELFGLFSIIEVYYDDRKPDEVKELYQANITHNLGEMAAKAELYDYLWRPGEKGIQIAKNLIEPLEKGLKELIHHPDKYQFYNPSNGWGSYGTLVTFVDEYLNACKENPEAEIYTWR